MYILRQPIAITRLVFGVMTAVTLTALRERVACMFILLTEAFLIYRYIERKIGIDVDHFGQEVHADRAQYLTTGLISTIMVVLTTLPCIGFAVTVTMDPISKRFQVAYVCLLLIYTIGEFVHFWAFDSFRWEINEILGGASHKNYVINDGSRMTPPQPYEENL